MAKKIIMSWSKCKIEVGKTGDDEAMAATLTDVGTINDKSTTLATEDGETLTATATGGIVVAEEEGEPVVTLTTRVKEMDFDKEKMFNGAEVSEDGDELTVKTNVVQGARLLRRGALQEVPRQGRRLGRASRGITSQDADKRKDALCGWRRNRNPEGWQSG